ncbi:Acb2/Tad1 domain-containing protein [Paenibacillus macerans]
MQGANPCPHQQHTHTGNGSKVPNSREKSLAMTKLEQSVFWANAGIARN